jgi:prefoldin subunit 5
MIQLDSMVTLFADTRSDIESKAATDVEATIQELREIRLEAEGVEVERCLVPYQQDILAYMDLKIEAFATVSLGESAKAVSEAFEASDQAYREYLEERNRLANTIAD